MSCRPSCIFTLMRPLVALLFLGAAASVGAQSSMAEAGAERLRLEIVEAMGKGEPDAKAALSAFDRYRLLKLKDPMPPALWFLQAKAAWLDNDAVRAFNSLEQFLEVTPPQGDDYQQALVLYPQYQARASEVRQAAKTAALLKLPSMLDEIKSNMVVIPAGGFRMGDVYGFGGCCNLPVHTVNVPSFRLAKYEVTFEQYDVFAAITGRTPPGDFRWGRGKLPVMNVSWGDAQAYAAWLSRQTGLVFRLPTEAEWEYAARAGSDSDYPWGSEFDTSQANSAYKTDPWPNTAPVGSLQANAFGLHDMIGNVAEWTQDCLNDSYTGAPSNGSAWLTGKCSQREVRGGAYNNRSNVSNRSAIPTETRIHFIGFRLAQDL